MHNLSRITNKVIAVWGISLLLTTALTAQVTPTKTEISSARVSVDSQFVPRFLVENYRMHVMKPTSAGVNPFIHLNSVDTDESLLGFSFNGQMQFSFDSTFDNVQDDDNVITFGSEDTTHMAFDGSGAVGINTTTLSDKLTVNGDIYSSQGFSGLYETTDGGSLEFTVVTTADLRLIATTSPGNNARSIRFNPHANKTFIINHPKKTDYYLVHSALEGPEEGVYYRGKAKLKNGKVTIAIPKYVEKLIDSSSVTIKLTNIDGFDQIKPRKTWQKLIYKNKFRVMSNNKKSNQAFYWELYANRKTGIDFETEVPKSKYTLARFGPYTFFVKALKTLKGDPK